MTGSFSSSDTARDVRLGTLETAAIRERLAGMSTKVEKSPAAKVAEGPGIQVPQTEQNLKQNIPDIGINWNKVIKEVPDYAVTHVGNHDTQSLQVLESFVEDWFKSLAYGIKNMQTVSPDTTYIDVTENINNPVVTNKECWGQFRCPAGSVSIWIPK